MPSRKPVCPTCGKAKPKTDFYGFSKQGGNVEGRSYRCKECEAGRKPAKKAKRTKK